MKPDIQGERTDAPAVVSEQLSRIVDQARRVPLPPLGVDAAQIHRGWWQQRCARWPMSVRCPTSKIELNPTVKLTSSSST